MTATTKPTTSKKQQTRKRIVDATIEGIKEHGYGGFGIDAIAKRAKVTSGAFYGHFRSKNQAFEAAVSSGMLSLVEGLSYWRETAGEHWLSAFIDWYLGIEHRDDICGGCSLPGLSVDVARAPKEVHIAYEDQLTQAVDVIAKSLSGSNTSDNENAAWNLLAILSGAVTMSRAMDSEIIANNIAQAASEQAKSIIESSSGS